MSVIAAADRPRTSNLEKIYERLRAAKKAGSLGPEERAALAECAFRLALRPGVSLSEAASLLIEGMRNDGSNPKYAYHLSRLLFLHDRIAEAQRWLVQACRLCPTSHRIWSHIYLLQAEIYARGYRDVDGRDQFDFDAAKVRRDGIADSVKKAENAFSGEWLDFVLPESRVRQENRERVAKAGGKKGRRGRFGGADPGGEETPSAEGQPSLPKVRRLRDADRCRWSGIEDLRLEFELRADEKTKSVVVARQNAVAPLAERLKQVADLAPQRLGGAAGFAVAGVQWLLAGYPAATVRRLASQFSDADRANLVSLRTLDLVCTIYEAPPAEAPRRLADAVQSGALPPTLAAVILRRYALWRPLEIESTRFYRAARRFLAEARERLRRGDDDKELQEEIVAWTKKVEQAAKKTQGDPPKTLKDDYRPAAKPDRLSAEEAVAALERFEDSSRKLIGAREELTKIVRDRIVPHAEPSQPASLRAQAAVDHGCAAAAIDSLREISQKKIAQLDRLSASLSHLRDALPKDFAERAGNCGRDLKEAAVVGPLRKNLDKSAKKFADVSSSGEPGADLQAVRSLLSQIGSETAPAPSGAAKTVPSTLDSLEALAASLARAKEEAVAFVLNDLEPRTESGDSAALAGARADRDSLEALLDAVKTAAAKGMERLEELRASLAGASSSDLPEGFNGRVETCANGLRDVQSFGSVKRRLDKMGRKLAGVEAGSLHPNVAALESLVAAAAASSAQPHAAESGASRGDSLAELETAVAEAVSLLDQAFERLGALVETHAARELTPEEANQAVELRRTFDDVMTRRDGFIQTAQRIGAAGDLPRDRLDVLERVQQSAVSLAQRKRPFLKKFERLPAAAAAAVPVSTGGAESASSASPNGHAGAAKRPPRPREAPPLVPLADAIARLDEGLLRSKREADAALASFSEGALEHPAMRALRISVEARWALTNFRLGRLSDARRGWATILRLDPLHAAARRNLAICEYYVGGGRDAAAWKAYAESVYFLDIVSGDLTQRAEERARMHRALGEAAVPRFLAERYQQELFDEEEAIAFLDDGARVREFVDQKLMEILNRMLGAKSPLIALGVTRDDSPAERADAPDAMAAFVREACGSFPGGMKAAIENAFLARIEEAKKQLADPDRLLAERDPTYARDREERLNLLHECALLKLKLYTMVVESPKLAGRLRSAAFLGEIARLDAIPMTHGSGFGEPVAQSLRVSREALRTFVGSIVQSNFGVAIARYLLDTDEEGEEARAQRDRQYRRLVERWCADPRSEPALAVIDNPGEFYPQSLQKLVAAATEQGLTQQILDGVKAFVDRFPRLSGIVRDYAELLQQANRESEAIALLRRAAETGLSKAGRRACRIGAAQLEMNQAIDDERFGASLEPALALLAEDDRSPNLVDHVIALHARAASDSGADPGSDRLSAAIGEWIERARQAKKQDGTPAVDAAALKQAASKKETSRASIRYALAVKRFNGAVSKAKDGLRDAALADLTAVRADLDFIDQAGDAQTMQNAAELRQEVGKLESQLTSG